MNMKKLSLLLAVSTVLGFGATARAADLVEAPTIYDWSGFYIGGNIGYGFGGDDKVGLLTDGKGAEPGGILGHDVDIGKLELEGIFGGGQIGFDHQMGKLVLGAVADIEASDVKDDFDSNVKDKFGFDTSVSASDKVDLWGTVRGRVGWAMNRVLVYGTGGLAWGEVNYDVKLKDDLEGDKARLSSNSTEIGYALGGGLAWAISDHWSIGGEYLYVNLGKQSLHGKVRFEDDNDPTGETLTTHPTPDFHSVKAFVNFKF